MKKKFRKIKKAWFDFVEYEFVWEELEVDKGCCSNPRAEHPTIMIDPYLSEKDLLEVSIHEALHASFWQIDESCIKDAGENISKMLWDIGFRLKKVDKPKK
jgi:hypothetical protein